MANESMAMSAEGLSDLRMREGAINRYYNDAANHCTFGVGALVHRGPCTVEELERAVTDSDIEHQLAGTVRAAERSVRAAVRRQALTQAQFDALVSYTFNVGPTGAFNALRAADSGDWEGVSRHMKSAVYVRPRDAHGNRLSPVRLPGLVNRRRAEAAPFENQVPR